MPDCPNCYVKLALADFGGVCPKCLNVYRPKAVQSMPGFDRLEVMEALGMLKVLMAGGLLVKGFNAVEFLENDLIINQLGELD